ncbi:PTS transporter subunit EIIC [Mycoplasma procyoni]|uniref:PTS transporter subunit EIIC n=1 Tax=Mycoplasma procyoni TaxID=568784 RepID=UPI00197BBA9A|nr:PTS transporter subunit EIIC [Mycoplasma procyoni]MBN3534609.1 PTS transporter subunit EIIC [Mycoplasma procyoni]
MQKFDWDNVSKEVVEALGGKENIKQYFNCATRLRVYVHDQTKIDLKKLSKVALAKGATLEGDQYQVIYGPGTVNKVVDNLNNYLNNNNTTENKQQTSTKKKLWNPELSFKSNLFLVLRWLVRSFSEIFVPLIPVFIAGGISLALTSFISTVSNSESAKGAAKFFELIGGAILGGLPALVGYTAMKKFGGNPFLGLAIGLIMISPALVNGWNSSNAKEVEGAFALFPSFVSFFQWKFIGYQAQIFPVLLIIAMAYYVEKLLKKYTPEALAIVVVPLVTVVFSVFFGFWFVGPIGRYIGIGIGYAANAIFTYTNFPGFGLGGLLIGMAYPFIVVTGLHQGFTAIEAQLIASQGFTWITSIATVSNIAQGVAALMMFVILYKKSQKLASSALSSGIAANLGITEPAMFGTNIPLFFPMLAASISAGIGGYWVGMSQTVASSLGSASWLGFIQFSPVKSDALVKYYDAYEKLVPWGNKMFFHRALAPMANIAIASVIASISSATLTFIFSKTFGKKALKEFIKENA